MMEKRFLFYKVFLLQIIFSLIKSVSYIDIRLDETLPVKEASTSVFFKFVYPSDFKTNSYLHILTIPTNPINPAKIYLDQSNSDIIPSPTRASVCSEKIGTNFVFFSSYQNYNSYIGIYCENNCDFNITATKTDKQYLSEQVDFAITTKYNKYLLTFIPKSNSKLLFYIFSDLKNDNDLKKVLTPKYKTNSQEGSYSFIEKLGYVLNINGKTSEPINITVTYEKDYGKVNIGVKYLDKPIPISVFEQVKGYLSKSEGNEICYQIKSPNLSQQSIHIDFTYIGSILNLVLKHSNGDIFKTETIKYNTYYLLDKTNFEENDIFCLSTIDSIDLSFSFQLTYPNLIQKYQLYIPVMNFHTIHKRKIASEQILFYICENKYTSWAKLFAHMTIISGKPVLYGYNYSGSIKAVDLTIIKSKDILHSTSSLIDSYVDSQYKQIQFIISCESKEDCEYYIDLGLVGQSQEYYNLELIPDVPVFTPIVPTNYFISNKYLTDKTQKAKLILTSISGSCSLNFTEKISYETKDVRGKIIYTIKDFTSTNIINFSVNSKLIPGSGCLIQYETETKDVIALNNKYENIEALSINDGKKQYSLSKSINVVDPYIIRIQSLNCRFNAQFNKEKQENKEYSQFIIDSTSPIFTNDNYIFDIEITSYNYISASNDDYCTLLISGSHISKGVILTEGNERMLYLNSKINTMSFYLSYVTSFPYLFFDFEEKNKINI